MMPRRPRAFLLFGPVGAGKTTLARRLEREGAVRFTPDEWMARLFGDDRVPVPDFAGRMAAIQELMLPLWRQCLLAGADVVLDYGFWRRRERNAAREAVRGAGAVPVLVALECSEEEARWRVARRNDDPGRSLHIAPAAFEALRRRVEPLGNDEDRIAPPA